MAKAKWFNKNILGMGLGSLFSDLSHEMATAILPMFLSAELNAAAFALGLIEGLSDLSSSLVKTYSGFFSDKIGKRKPLIAFGYFLTGFVIPSIGLATSWTHVLFSRTVGWMGRGIRGPPRDALLADSVDKAERSHAFGFERMMDTIGAIMGPALAFLLLPILGFRNIFYVSLIPGIAAFLAILFLVKEKPMKAKPDMKLLKTVSGMTKEFKTFLIAAGIFGVANFANTFLVLRVMQALTPSLGALKAGGVAAALYVLLNIGAAIFAYITGAIGDKTSKKTLIMLGYLIFAIYCVGFVILPPTLINFALLFVLAGVETGLIDVMERAYSADLLPPEARGTGYGMLNTVNGIGDFISSLTAGILWTTVSFTVAFAYGAAMAMLAVAVLLISKNKKHIT